jgi:hypothetical protein
VNLQFALEDQTLEPSEAHMNDGGTGARCLFYKVVKKSLLFGGSPDVKAFLSVLA